MTPSQLTPLQFSVLTYMFGEAVCRIRALDMREPTWNECRLAYKAAKKAAEIAVIRKGTSINL